MEIFGISVNTLIGGFIALALIVCGAWVIFGVIVTNRKTSYPFDSYPFDDPAYIHVGMNPVQEAALADALAVKATYQHCPRHRGAIDAVYFAMTEAEFLRFHAELMKHTRVLIAETALRQETFLRGPTFALSAMLIELAPIRERLDPGAAERDFVQSLPLSKVLASQ